MFPFYEDLDKYALEFLKIHLQPIYVPKDTILFSQDDICDSILFLTSGEIALSMKSDAEEEIFLYRLKAGEQCIVNTASTLSQTKAVATATTLSDIEGYIIDMYSIKELIANCRPYQEFIFSLYRVHMGSLVKINSKNNNQE
jgi:CRP/FNR family transcriptional regulator